MGYHAPEAEAVYRYIFRLDRGHGRLTDGFSWSILFLNDTSRQCSEFLLRYGAELCHRTADRIRFVFFSGLSPQETQALASDANRQGKGFLSRVIAAAGEWGFRRRFDWERDPWERFRPDAFRPLRTGGEVEERLSMECEIHTAMPGSEEALRLAQRLGIGRFVPCFILFSDIGSHTVRLLPMDGSSPDRIFTKLRQWIDEFYEVNRSVLEHWKGIEGVVEEACRRFEAPVSDVNRWKQQRAGTWQKLRRCSGYVARLKESAPGLELLHEISSDWDLPWNARNLATSTAESFELVDRKRAGAQEVATAVLKITEQTDALVVRAQLADLHRLKQSVLPHSVNLAFDRAIRAFTWSAAPAGPEEMLFAWWRSPHGRTPSRNRYDKHRAAWVAESTEKHGADAVGRVAEILREEFAVIERTAMAQPLTNSAEDAADAVVVALADHLDLSSDKSWNERVAPYRQVLVEYFTQLREHAPPWLMAHSDDALLWQDCIPSLEHRKAKNWYGELPRLARVLENVKSNWQSEVDRLEAARRAERQDALAGLAAEIDRWVSPLTLSPADKESAWLTLISGLSAITEELEQQTFANAQSLSSARYPGKEVSRGEAMQLMLTLDDYDRAVASLRLPFESDRDVLRISVDVSPIEAAGLAERSHGGIGKAAKSVVEKAVRDAETTAEQWPAIKREAATWSPGGALVSALHSVVTPQRLNELGVATPTSRDEIVQLLDAIDVHELLALERAVSADRPRNGQVPASKQALFDAIFLAIGLLPQSADAPLPSGGALREKLDTLAGKMKRNAFDVFLAHHSRDSTQVRRLGEELRARGIYPWIDVEQVPPGLWFQDVIQSAVRSVKAAAIVIGAAGVGRWQAVELRTFMSRCVEQNIPLIPVLLPGAAIPDELPFLRELNYVQFMQDVTETDGIARLVWGITGERAAS